MKVLILILTIAALIGCNGNKSEPLPLTHQLSFDLSAGGPECALLGGQVSITGNQMAGSGVFDQFGNEYTLSAERVAGDWDGIAIAGNGTIVIFGSKGGEFGWGGIGECAGTWGYD